MMSHSVIQRPRAWRSGCSRAASAPGARAAGGRGGVMPALSSLPPLPFMSHGEK